jgi:hypothetical protein
MTRRKSLNDNCIHVEDERSRGQRITKRMMKKQRIIDRERERERDSK